MTWDRRQVIFPPSPDQFFQDSFLKRLSVPPPNCFSAIIKNQLTKYIYFLKSVLFPWTICKSVFMRTQHYYCSFTVNFQVGSVSPPIWFFSQNYLALIKALNIAIYFITSLAISTKSLLRSISLSYIIKLCL